MRAVESNFAAAAGVEQEVCLSCLQLIVPGTHFCPHCGTPLSTYATTAPFESVFAEGDFWRKALSQARWHPFRRVLHFALLLLLLAGILSGMLLPR